MCNLQNLDEDRDELGEFHSGIPKLIKYKAIFGLKLLVSSLDINQNEWSHVEIHATCRKNIGNSIRKRRANPENSRKRHKIARKAT